MINKVVCAKVFNMRYEACGSRFTNMLPEHFQVEKIDWTPMLPYLLTWEGSRATAITHIQGDSTKLKEHVVITRDFELSDIYDDMAAKATLESTVHHLNGFFGDQSGPHKVLRNSAKNNVLATLVQSVIEEMKVASSDRVGASTPLKKMDKPEEKNKQAERARQALAERAMERKKRSRISLHIE
eukprot:5218230-Lingulodinium_polyedra.AAC.1